MTDSRAVAPGKRRSDFPIVTWSLIGLNVAVYAATMFTFSSWKERYDEFYMVFGLVARDAHFFNMLTSCFLHSDVVHLLTNMLFLWLFGRTLERALGAIEYIMVYVGSGLFAAITHLAIVYAFLPQDAELPSLGASGAIAGILGMYAIRFVRHKLHLFGMEIPSALLLLAWLFLQMFLGVFSLYVPTPTLKAVDYWAHMGGFMFGMIVAHLTHLSAVGRKEYLLNDAEDSYRRGTLLDVIRKYEALLRYDTNDPFTRAELGRTWALLDDEEQASKYYSTAIDLYLKTNGGTEAAARYQELLYILPNSQLPQDLLYRLGCYLEESDKPWRAIEVLNKVCPPNGPETECQMAALKVAQIQLNKVSRPHLAAATLEQFLRTYPNSEWRALAEQLLRTAHTNSEKLKADG
ncbi:MAG: rhomboid family intramembrane serine protease [Armatimonadota bacterium]|nr:rhomboid family intramembrane serine protease [Armatimonadota bacterium]